MKTAQRHGTTKEERTGDGTGEAAGGERAPANGERIAKKSAGLGGRAHRPGRREWAQAIQSLRPEHKLDLMLDIKGMARSTYYYGVKERGDSRCRI